MMVVLSRNGCGDAHLSVTPNVTTRVHLVPNQLLSILVFACIFTGFLYKLE